MPENNLSQRNSIILGVVLILFLIAGYFWYRSSQDIATTAPVVPTVDPELFNSDVRAFYLAKNKIDFSDLSFMKKPFYTQLKDNTVEIPSIKPTGRPNPFIPYASP